MWMWVWIYYDLIFPKWWYETKIHIVIGSIVSIVAPIILYYNKLLNQKFSHRKTVFSSSFLMDGKLNCWQHWSFQYIRDATNHVIQYWKRWKWYNFYSYSLFILRHVKATKLPWTLCLLKIYEKTIDILKLSLKKTRLQNKR